MSYLLLKGSGLTRGAPIFNRALDCRVLAFIEEPNGSGAAENEILGRSDFFEGEINVLSDDSNEVVSLGLCKNDFSERNLDIPSISKVEAAVTGRDESPRCLLNPSF